MYLDFQAFDIYSKDSEVKGLLDEARAEYHFFCSTAHLEELFRAQSNANSESGKKQAALLKDSIEKLCVPGVLNPGYDTMRRGVELRNETLDSCLSRIEEYDTRESVMEVARALKERYKQPPSFSSKYHDSAEQWKRIWYETSVKSAIKVENEGQEKPGRIADLYCRLAETYGETKAALAAERARYGCSQKLYPGCYAAVRDSYEKLEYVIEILARILSRCGYHRDKDVRGFNSGEYDISHMIYATFCDRFITRDTNLYHRAKAIYCYMGVPTAVVSWDGWIDSLKPGGSVPA